MAKTWEKLSDLEKLKYLDITKLVEKKNKKKRDDETFKPGTDP